MSKLVMIVDDSLTVRKIVEVVLSREGYEVIAVPDGVEALRSLLTAANGPASTTGGAALVAARATILPATARETIPPATVQWVWERGPAPGPLPASPSPQAPPVVRPGRLPDLILLDIEMPRMNGYQVALSLRKRPQLAHIPLVMLSRRAGVVDRLKARLAGVRGYLTKPFTEQDLRALVAACIGPAHHHQAHPRQPGRVRLVHSG